MAVNYEYFYMNYELVPERLDAIHVLRTPASNIKLKNYNKNNDRNLQKILDAGDYGVNGAFFNAGDDADLAILMIAMQDGNPVGPGNQGMNNGNTMCKSGIGWNGTNLLGYQGSLSSANTTGSHFSSSGTWLQGGIGLYLGNGNWKNLMQSEFADQDYYVESNLRTALVARLDDKKVDLIVSEFACTVADFREMIERYTGIAAYPTASSRFYGIMLDGGRSSQMVVKKDDGSVIEAPEALVTNLVMRKVAQVITLKNKT